MEHNKTSNRTKMLRILLMKNKESSTRGFLMHFLFLFSILCRNFHELRGGCPVKVCKNVDLVLLPKVLMQGASMNLLRS